MIKKTRFTIQNIFFIFTLSVFYGLIKTPEIKAFYASFHVLTNFSSLVWLVTPLFWWVTVILVLLPFLAGRIYCSYLCPVGFTQDIIARFSKKNKKKIKTKNHIRLVLFFISIGLLVTGTSLYGYIDHLSSFFRVLGLLRFNFSISFILGIIFLLVITVMPFYYKRWFCNVLCPTGTFYSILSKFSMFRVVINKECNKCRTCETKCPSSCIEKGKIDKTLCIDCLECLEACPVNAFELTKVHSFNKLFWISPFDHGRRRFISNGILSAIAGFSGFMFGSSRGNRVILSSNTVLPPGAKTTFHFFQKCTSCGACMSVCPTDVLKPGNLENGFPGLGKPMMDYNNSSCSYECNACLSVCPTQALTYFPLKIKKQIKIGTAVIDKSTCIPYAQKQECGACAEHCPTGGIKSELINGILSPITNEKYCIGCGLCQKVCPVGPIRAVVVKPENVHTLSYHPNAMDYGKGIKTPETNDFPF